MNTNNHISRHELSQRTGLSTECIRKSEHKIGLKICRVKWPGRQVIYRREEALRILKALGFVI